MNFKEITTISQQGEPYVPFGLSRTHDDNIFCALNRKSAHILELQYNHHYDGNINVIQSSMEKPSNFIPSKELHTDAVYIYENASKEERHRLLLDPHLLSTELNISENNISFISGRWSPKFGGKLLSSSSCYYLAYLTNFGGCEIRTKAISERSWNVVISDVGKIWIDHYKKHSINTFAALQKAVNEIQLTAISWNNQIFDGCLGFATITASGTIVFFELNHTRETKIIFEKHFCYKNTNTLEWFTFHDKRKKVLSYLIIGDINGNIHLHTITIDSKTSSVIDIGEMRTLFMENDGVRVHNVQWDYCSRLDRCIIIVCKGMHLFTFLLNPRGDLLSTNIHYVGHYPINGIYKQTNFEYIVGTQSGLLQFVRITIESNNKLMLTTNNCKTPVNHTKYALCGLTGSTNNAFLLMSLYAAQTFDHLVLREPACIAFCQQLGNDSLTKLLENPTHKLTKLQDLAELTRCIQLKDDDIFKDYRQTIPSKIVCSDTYLYTLKIRLIVISARSTYLRQKYRAMESNILLAEYEIIKKIIFAILSVQRLTHINSLKGIRTSFQLLSACKHRAYLREFIEFDIVNEYEILKKTFCPTIQVILAETEEFDKGPCELCVYCEQEIEAGKLMCKNDHDMPRCCVSMIQVPLMNKLRCPNCQLVALDDLDLLKEITDQQNEQIFCVLCDSEMIKIDFEQIS